MSAGHSKSPGGHFKMKTWTSFCCIFTLFTVAVFMERCLFHEEFPIKGQAYDIIVDANYQNQFHKTNLLDRSLGETLNVPAADNIVDVAVDWYLKDADKFDPETECMEYIPNDQLTIPTERYMIALASYPRSGNRFTRQDLYRITYQNKQAYKSVKGLDVNETETDRICYKTHAHDIPTIKYYFDGAILLLRNPRDVAVSYFFWNYAEKGKYDQDTLKEWMKMNDPMWTNWTRQVLVGWRNTNLDWIKYGHKVLISYTEEISKNPVRELSRMMIFGGEMVPLNFLQCTLHTYPWLSRKHVDFEPLFPEALMKQYVNEVNETLLGKGARPLPTYRSTYL